MKNPIQVLLDEHEIIVSATDLAKQADQLIETDPANYETVIRKLISFFRLYADQYHHYKEERILFPEMNKKNELLEDGVIKEMMENHEDFRSMIKGVEFFLDRRDYTKARQQLHIYTEALLDHIAVENDEVFQMAETLMNAAELEKMYFKFEDCDEEIAELNRLTNGTNKVSLVEQLNEIKKSLLSSQETKL